MTAPSASSPKYTLVLALVSALILLVGSSLRPRDTETGSAPPPSETELARLARLTQRRSLENMTAYFASMASDLESSVKRLSDEETSGIVWDADTVLTARLEQPAGGPHPPVRAVQMSGAPDLSPARRRTSPVQPGDWIVAVWHTGHAPSFAPGTFIGTAPVSCGEQSGEAIASTVSLTRPMTGGGLFDLDGGFLGMIVPCDGQFVALSGPSVDAMVKHASTPEARLLAEYGLAVGSLTQAEQAYFKTEEGAIVREVWVGSPGEHAGLMPGDIIHDLSGEPVQASTDLHSLITSTNERSFQLGLLRASRRSRIVISRHHVPAQSNRAATQSAGLVWETARDGYRIESVLPGSPAANAGIRPGDRLLRINHLEPRSLDQVRRLVSSAQALPAFVELRRDRRRWGVLISEIGRTDG